MMAIMDDEKTVQNAPGPALSHNRVGDDVDQVVDASGHTQDLERQFGLVCICSIDIMVGF